MSDGMSPNPHDRPLPPSRFGLVLFALYVVLYGGFMALVLLRPDLLASRPFGGVNLAILAGLGLIGGAVVLSALSMIPRSESRSE